MDRKYAIQISGIFFLTLNLLINIRDQYIYTFSALFSAYFLSSSIGNIYSLIKGSATFQQLVKSREFLNLIGVLLVIPILLTLPKKYVVYSFLLFIVYTAIGFYIGRGQRKFN